ncbi:MAG: ArsC/Spx/MgsR family protein [Actinomycetota bacterium]|nr:ArsC/Spx/MgsR family protein [Actinomycetota bacterium]MEC9467462.1 ArsC/Spx/MgsR family protein [Actinomycetota bacterium]MED6328184.1 ArsC/Spx/MgsR family protein [Actinomycetota bacterium]MEE2958573.1 ArsC/Spx/MgsR family protein [Actinomycetota bacterium]
MRILGAVDEVPGDMVRRDPAFADSGVVEASLDDLDAVVDLLLAHPALMQRPVGLVGDRAVVARPSERILDLLDD